MSNRRSQFKQKAPTSSVPLPTSTVVLAVHNDGPAITKTNYWQTAYNHCAKFFVSLNGPTFRVLVPDAAIDEMREGVAGATHVVVTRGPWRDTGLPDAIEIMFDDGTDNPFALMVTPEACDFLPPRAKAGTSGIRCIAYGRGLVVLADLPVQFRLANIPCMASWQHV